MKSQFILVAACLLLAGTAGCASSAERAAQAAAEGQAAMDRGDYVGARESLSRAVQVDDDQAVLWSALGRALLALGDVGNAYHAYARVAELDRTNPEALQLLADVSLLSGRVREAERYADQLELLRPGSPGPATTKGFIALARSRPEDALRAADTLLSAVPFDQSATILKGRALDALGSTAAGVRVLEEQVAARGPSRPVLDTLLTLYRKADHKPGILETRARLAALAPEDAATNLAYARELYAAGKRDAGRRITLGLAGSDERRISLDDVLAVWLAHEAPEQAARNARALVGKAGPAERVALARFFLDLKQPGQAEALLRAQAAAPVDTGNADAAAVYAEALAAGGRREQASTLLNAVLAFDGSNIFALRARTDLHLAAGRAGAALTDARRLVGESPTVAEDRLRLANCYVALGQPVQAESVYWQAFNEIPGNPAIYGELKAFLRRSGKADATASLDRRFAEQQQALRTSRA